MYKNTIFNKRFISNLAGSWGFIACYSLFLPYVRAFFSVHVLTFNLSTPIFKDQIYSMTHDISIERALR
jgi:hypothetical protein